MRGFTGPGKKFELHFRCSGKEVMVGLKLGSNILSLILNTYLNLSNWSLDGEWQWISTVRSGELLSHRQVIAMGPLWAAPPLLVLKTAAAFLLLLSRFRTNSSFPLSAALQLFHLGYLVIKLKLRELFTPISLGDSPLIGYKSLC